MRDRNLRTLWMLLTALPPFLSAQEAAPGAAARAWSPEATLVRRGFLAGLGREPAGTDLVRLGEVLQEEELFEEERACYAEALGLDPECSPAHGHLALWHYTRGGRFRVVFEATLRFLETSPRRDVLGQARADFRLHGGLRLAAAEHRGLVGKARELSASGDAAAGAALLENAARDAQPGVAGPWLALLAGRLRLEGGDPAGAQAAFQAALAQPAGPVSMEARLGLARLACGRGELETALGHLRAAVAEGSAACGRIEEGREGPFRPLFTAGGASMAEEVEELLDPEKGDAPLKARIAQALAGAGREGKRVLLYWYGPFCPYVMAMEEVLARPAVRAVLAERFVVVAVDLGSLHRATTVSEEFGGIMETLGVPGFHVLDPDGRVHEVQRADEALMGAPHRCYDEGLVKAFLERAGARK